MKNFQRVLMTAAALSVSALPLAVSAQTTTQPGMNPPPNGAPGARAGRFAQMRQMRRQMEQIRTQARTQMLGALSPRQQALLATIAGRLATAQQPDFRAAAQQLDAALSPSEKQAIVAAERNARTQMRAAFASMRPGGPNAGRNAGPNGERPNRPAQTRRRAPDAGAILLASALHFGGPMHGGHGEHGGRPAGPPPQR